MVRTNKYGNCKVTVDEHVFDSKKEASQYQELKLLERAGVIQYLRLQPEYELQAAFIDNTGKRHRAIVYRADFTWKDVQTGRYHVRDAKGFKTTEFKLKEKMFLYRYPEYVLEVI